MKSIFKTFILSVLVFAQVHFAFAQTASILPLAKTTFNDQNGKPLTSGTVDFYIPSTTTRKTTWQDAAETIPNTNPVVLDGAGRGLILGSGSYRQVVKDRNGNLVWDQVTSSVGSGGGGAIQTGDGDLVGTIKPWAGWQAPNQYVFAYGEELNRTTYAILFTAITSSQTIFCSSGSPTLSGFTDTTNFPIGAAVEVSCITAGTSTIVAKTSNTVTLAVNSVINTSTTATVFPWGNGDHSTTFNVPDFRGLIPVGNNSMGGVPSGNLSATYFGTDPNSTGGAGGSQTRVLQSANLPPYTPTGSVGITDPGHTHTSNAAANVGGSSTGGGDFLLNIQSAATINSALTGITASFSGNAQGGTSSAFGIIPPSKTTNYIIKVTPDANSATASGVTSLGGMTGSVACGAGLLCTGNIITNIGPSATSITVGSTIVSAGSNTNILFNNAGVLGEYAVASFADFYAGTANKILTTGTIWASETTTTFGSTTSFDFNTFKNTAVTLTGNISIQTLTNVKAGQSGMITFIQDGTGSRTTAWNSIFKFSSGVTPTLTTTAGAIDILNFSCRSATFCEASLLNDVR